MPDAHRLLDYDQARREQAQDYELLGLMKPPRKACPHCYGRGYEVRLMGEKHIVWVCRCMKGKPMEHRELSVQEQEAMLAVYKLVKGETLHTIQRPTITKKDAKRMNRKYAKKVARRLHQ